MHDPNDLLHQPIVYQSHQCPWKSWCTYYMNSLHIKRKWESWLKLITEHMHVFNMHFQGQNICLSFRRAWNLFCKTVSSSQPSKSPLEPHLDGTYALLLYRTIWTETYHISRIYFPIASSTLLHNMSNRLGCNTEKLQHNSILAHSSMH